MIFHINIFYYPLRLLLLPFPKNGFLLTLPAKGFLPVLPLPIEGFAGGLIAGFTTAGLLAVILGIVKVLYHHQVKF